MPCGMMTLEQLRKRRQEIRRELDDISYRKQQLNREKKTITKLLRSVKLCRNCNYCMVGDGEPYCAIQDLYTHVDLDAECTAKAYLERKSKFCKV